MWWNYPFLNFNGATVEVNEMISNFIPHFTGHVITYPCVKWATDISPLPQRSLWHNRHWTVDLCWFSPWYAGTRKPLIEAPLFKCNSSDSKHGLAVSHEEDIQGNHEWIGWKIKTSTCNNIMFNCMLEFWYIQLNYVISWYECMLQYVYGSRSFVFFVIW